jgi:DNA-binding response OmpR family regulator
MKKEPSKRTKSHARPPAGDKVACRGCLLLVEDHKPTRDSLRMFLTGRQFDVRAASCVREAWALVEEVKFDALVSDIGLPDGDGYMLMRELKDRYGMKGIALTGFDLEDDFKLSQEAGFSIHLVKPVKANALDLALRSLGI